VHGGTESVIDAFGCAPERLADRGRVEALLERVIAELGLHVVGAPQVHVFGGAGGVTALYLLSESHLAAHTFPETGIATVNLYCCRPRPSFPWPTALAEAWGAARVTVRELERGAPR
jgi:S-adenosylmethionine decarboxylase